MGGLSTWKVYPEKETNYPKHSIAASRKWLICGARIWCVGSTLVRRQFSVCREWFVASSRDIAISLLSSRIVLPMPTEWDISLRGCYATFSLLVRRGIRWVPAAYMFIYTCVHVHAVLSSSSRFGWLRTRSAPTNDSIRARSLVLELLLMGPFSCIVLYQSRKKDFYIKAIIL